MVAAPAAVAVARIPARWRGGCWQSSSAWKREHSAGGRRAAQVEEVHAIRRVRDARILRRKPAAWTLAAYPCDILSKVDRAVKMPVHADLVYWW